ncbi:conserved Plasmodium protein, unknown function [Plasmodium relictum]|uniref:Asparagine-rich protein n=1 Tax=Plasmodium relictum TaxID=85471 RepID=A0A1J1HA29_PLARL|nr:conserved Plasmodium protein, unknown function [Plasmodium relictum]CRH01368.1 conserved Plasmodium protein, unknown function [Plasmodium relictum]
MASSQIRQFATLIDQLPCEADDFNLMEKFEDYSKCFENSFHNSNLKNSNSFFPFNSNLNDYINNISSSQSNLNYNNINQNDSSNSSFNENGKKNLFSENSNSQKKNSEHENLKNFNVSYVNKSESNSCTNNEPPKNINITTNFDENNLNINKNQNDTSNDNNSNSSFSLVNDLQNYEKNNYMEKLKNEIEDTMCKYLTNKKNSLYNNNFSEIINHNNEYLTDAKFSNNNKSNDNISLYNLNNHVNDESSTNKGENIVYRYNINTPLKSVNYNNKKNNVENLKASSYINNNEENRVNELLYEYKKNVNSGEINKESTSNVLYMSENFGNNEENNMSISDNNLNNDKINNNRKLLNKNINLKYPPNENSITSDYRELHSMLKKNDNFNKNILLTKKAKVIKLDSNKSLIIFPVNIHEYGEKYIAVNQKDLLEYISSSIEFDNEDISSLKIKIYQKEKELQNIKAAYSMQTTNIHYLINRVIFKECEYEQLKHKSFTLEHEINKLIQEINSLINQNKEGIYMQKIFIDYKCMCVLKLQELQPLLGAYYFDIFHYITSCRTLGQLSIWIPAFEIKNDSLESIANHLIKILLNGLGAPFNTSPQYFLYNKHFLKKSISMESEDTFLNNLAKRKIIDNYLVNNFNSFNTTKENNSHLSNCQSLSMNSESSSIMGTEELFFNSSKFPSMHSVILKNNKNNKKKEKLYNELNRSNTTHELLCIYNESYNHNDTFSSKNNREAFICNNQSEQKFDNLIADKENIKKRKKPIVDDGEKENEKIICPNKALKKRNIENDQEKIEKEGDCNEMNNKLKETQQSKEYYEEIKLKEILKENQISFENQMEKNLGREKSENTEKKKKSEKDNKIDEVNDILENENNNENNINEIYNSIIKKEKKANKEKEKRKSKEYTTIDEKETITEIKSLDEINAEKIINGKKITEKKSKKEANIEKDMNKKKSIEIEIGEKKSIEHELGKKKNIEYDKIKRIKIEQMELVKKSTEQESFKKNKIDQQELFKKKNTEEKDKEKYYESKNIKEKEKQNESLKDKYINKNNKKSNDFNKQKNFKKELDNIIEEKNESKKKKKCKTKLKKN